MPTIYVECIILFHFNDSTKSVSLYLFYINKHSAMHTHTFCNHNKNNFKPPDLSIVDACPSAPATLLSDHIPTKKCLSMSQFHFDV